MVGWGWRNLVLDKLDNRGRRVYYAKVIGLLNFLYVGFRLLVEEAMANTIEVLRIKPVAGEVSRG